MNNCSGSAEVVTKSGETYTVLRSGKRQPSTATAQHEDFVALMDNDITKKAVRDRNGKPKRVLMVQGDGGPDEDMCFIKIACCDVKLLFLTPTVRIKFSLSDWESLVLKFSFSDWEWFQSDMLGFTL